MNQTERPPEQRCDSDGARSSKRPRHPDLLRHAARKAALGAADSVRERPSRTIAELRRTIAEQEAIIEVLKGALAAAGLDQAPEYQDWMKGLTPQERALLGALYRGYPRPLDKHALLEVLPSQDHAEERMPELVVVKVCDLRKKLGGSAIENIRGLGYRLSCEQHQAMRRAVARSADPRMAS